jgi:hypothetical protein
MRRDAFEKTTGFDGSYVVDLTMWLNMLEYGSAVKIHQVLSAFRISRSSWSFQLRKSQAAETVELFERTSRRFQLTQNSFDLLRGKIMAQIFQTLRMTILIVIERKNRN